MRKSKLTFTSYPGALYSGDEFYITNNKLCIFQSKLTPINFLIYKQALDEKEYIPDFMRIMAANYHAGNAVRYLLIQRKNGLIRLRLKDQGFMLVSG
jgi:succinate dehydrogenase/fumarate reductase cytochrome b subunit